MLKVHSYFKRTFDLISLRIKLFFTSGHKRNIEAKKNILALLIIKSFSIIISLLLVPLTIHYINPTQYGIWLTLSSIIAWFSFFDIGFGNGLRNKFAEAKASGDNSRSKIYISTTYAILTIIFVCLWIIFFFVNHFLNWKDILNAISEDQRLLASLGLIVFSFFCIQMILTIINTVLIADQKPAFAAFFDMLGQFLTLAVIFILTKTTNGSLLYLAGAIGLSPILVLIVSSLFFYGNKYKQFAPSWKNVHFAYAKDIMKLGAKFFIIQISGIFIYQTSNIIIAHVCGPQDVTVYNIAFKYLGIPTMLFSIVMAPFWSSFTNAYHLNDFEWMSKSYIKLRKVALMIISLVVVLIIISDFAYKMWVGEMIKIRISISVIVGLYVISNIWNTLHSLIINGIGKIKFQLYLAVTGAILNIPLAVLLGRNFGIEGVVMAAFLLNLLSCIFLPLQVEYILKKKQKGLWNE